MTFTREEAYDIIAALNEEAYDFAYDDWVKAGDDEEAREEVSLLQQRFFRELYGDLDSNTRSAIEQFVRTDGDFAEDFYCWHGEEN